MKKEKVLVVGSSGHAKVIIDIFEKNNVEVVGVVDDYRDKSEKTFDYNVLGSVIDIPGIINKFEGCKVFVAVGDNFGRHLVVSKIKNLIPEVEFLSAVHPSAQIGKNVILG